MQKVAIVYDRVNKWGGAERVLLALQEIFPQAPLFTSVYAPSKARWAQDFPRVVPTFLNKLPFLRDKHELLGTLMPLAFESLNFSGYDLVISVTSEAAKGILTSPDTKHICYCLTPTRYLWSHYQEYFNNPLLKFVSRPAVNYLKKWDAIAAHRPDVMLAISTAVQQRIKKYYQRDAQIIFPPVEVEKFSVDKSRLPTKAGEYYLVVSRLVDYKRVDLAIRAFNKLGQRLIVIGTGGEENKLKQLAKKNIEFITDVSDTELAGYYQGACALIMPQEEDFGIVAVESQAAGTPVIAYSQGGALDTVTEGLTGIFFREQSVKSLIDAVKRFARMEFKTKDIVENAQRFSKAEFQQNFKKLLETQSIKL